MNNRPDDNIFLVKKILSNSNYTAKTWDREDAFRYVFKIKENILEGAFFIHYKDNKIIKYVVELPISYGCPIKCKHCASGAINSVTQLNSIDIVNMFDYISSDNKIKKSQKILVTYSGIGEGALQKKNLLQASIKIFYLYSKVYFNFSTVGYDPSFIKFCEDSSKIIPIHHIQITYLHFDNEQLSKIIPNPKKLGFNFSELVNAIFNSEFHGSRFNYVLISGYNDSEEHFNKFISLVEKIKNKVIIRVSRLNDTAVSLKNNLSSPPYETLNILYSKLIDNGFDTHIFTPETNNNMNCGQLSWEYKNKNKNKNN